MKKSLLLAALLAVAMLAGLILALLGDGAWDVVAYVLIAPALILVAQVSARAMHGMRAATTLEQSQPRQSAKET
ncbi:hypothetical protein [Caulobacter sp. BP25]|uniref:hypothetical protein n=1 Tax=Caulobacter sp. BP25 TaxID=2048900 RepID=UPI000C12E0FF|nr:hypothetical protein [Caulobacter sp. BP25]PHY22631.1 hypothetical protein CSW59_01035 [Caulobacter sp. BP25]